MPPKGAGKTAPGSAQKNKARKTAAVPAARAADDGDDGDATPTKARKTKASKVGKTPANVQRTFYSPPTMSALHTSTCATPF